MEIKKITIKGLKISLLIYLLFGVFLFLSQRSLIYHPNEQDFNDCPGFKEYQGINHNGTRFYYYERSPDQVLVHYHGNAGSTCDRSFLRSVLEQNNNSIIFVEYAGYSNDDRRPSEKLILKDVENINDFLEKNNFQNITVYGQSIGAGAASYQAHTGKVDSLILISPFSSLENLVRSKLPIYPISFLLKEEYNNMKWLKNYKGRLIIFHGDEDSIIPSRFSKKLFEKIPSEEKKYVLLENFGHNDIWLSSEFQKKLVTFIKKANNSSNYNPPK